MVIAEVKLIIGGAFLVILFGILSSAFIAHFGMGEPDKLSTNIGSWACRAEQEVCPDGTLVGRIPPYCQYSNCN